jgi:hypothetical protein
MKRSKREIYSDSSLAMTLTMTMTMAMAMAMTLPMGAMDGLCRVKCLGGDVSLENREQTTHRARAR